MISQTTHGITTSLPVNAGLLADKPPLLKLRVTGLSDKGRVVASLGVSWVVAAVVINTRERELARLITNLSFSSLSSLC